MNLALGFIWFFLFVLSFPLLARFAPPATSLSSLEQPVEPWDLVSTVNSCSSLQSRGCRCTKGKGKVNRCSGFLFLHSYTRCNLILTVRGCNTSPTMRALTGVRDTTRLTEDQPFFVSNLSSGIIFYKMLWVAPLQLCNLTSWNKL